MHLGWLLIEKRTESIFFGRFFNIRRVPQYGFHLVETALWRLLKLWSAGGPNLDLRVVVFRACYAELERTSMHAGT